MGRHGNIQPRPMPAPGRPMQTKPMQMPPGAAGPGGQDIGQALQAMRQQLQAPPGAAPLAFSAPDGPPPVGPGGASQMDQMAGLAPRYQEMAMKMGPQFAMQRAQDFAAGKLPGQQGQTPVMKPSLPMPLPTKPNPMGGGLNPAAGGRMPGVPGGSPPIFGGQVPPGGGMKPDFGAVLDAVKGGRADPSTGGAAIQPGQGGPMMSKPLPFDPGGQGMQAGVPMINPQDAGQQQWLGAHGFGGGKPGMQIDDGGAGQGMTPPWAPPGGGGGGAFLDAQAGLRGKIQQAMGRRY